MGYFYISMELIYTNGCTAASLTVDGVQEEVAHAYNIEKYDNTSTLSIYNTDKKLLYNDNDTFAYGHNPYKCFE